MCIYTYKCKKTETSPNCMSESAIYHRVNIFIKDFNLLENGVWENGEIILLHSICQLKIKASRR